MKLKPDETLTKGVFKPLLLRAFQDKFYTNVKANLSKMKET